ncbi:MAG: hypothetical protein ACFFDN_35995 [Candidatus Hodarchaeota archaeon]
MKSSIVFVFHFAYYTVDNNRCIISYWGKSTKKAQRIGEITSAFVLGRFEENITSKDALVDFIMSKLNQGEIALNQTRLESVDKKNHSWACFLFGTLRKSDSDYFL